MNRQTLLHHAAIVTSETTYGVRSLGWRRWSVWPLALLALLTTGTAARAQQAPGQAVDMTKAQYVSAAELAAQIARQPTDRNGTIARLLQAPPFAVNIEHRMPGPQSASVHDIDAELFYIVDGAATIVTGGTLIEPTRNGANLSSTKGIQGGTRQRIAKGDFVMVPAGVAHWFVDIEGALTQMALHLPIPK